MPFGRRGARELRDQSVGIGQRCRQELDQLRRHPAHRRVIEEIEVIHYESRQPIRCLGERQREVEHGRRVLTLKRANLHPTQRAGASRFVLRRQAGIGLERETDLEERVVLQAARGL